MKLLSKDQIEKYKSSYRGYGGKWVKEDIEILKQLIDEGIDSPAFISSEVEHFKGVDPERLRRKIRRLKYQQDK